jgi:hypothetical protein
MSNHQESTGIWEELVASILSVNRYSLEKTYSILGNLKNEGICEPHNLMKWDEAEISKRLYKAGYKRGPFMTGLFANRLSGVGDFIHDVGLNTFENTILCGKKSDIKHLLMQAPGIGPVVMDNFFLLRGIK